MELTTHEATPTVHEVLLNLDHMKNPLLEEEEVSVSRAPLCIFLCEFLCILFKPFAILGILFG